MLVYCDVEHLLIAGWDTWFMIWLWPILLEPFVIEPCVIIFLILCQHFLFDGLLCCICSECAELFAVNIQNLKIQLKSKTFYIFLVISQWWEQSRRAVRTWCCVECLHVCAFLFRNASESENKLFTWILNCLSICLPHMCSNLSLLDHFLSSFCFTHDHWVA